MEVLRLLYHFLKLWCMLLKQFFSNFMVNHIEIRLENIALRSQLMREMEKQKLSHSPKRKQNMVFKQLWVILSKVLPNWKDLLFKVKPETVIGWHRTAFKIHWRRKSKKMGRPSISNETIELIKKLHKENPSLSPEKLHEQIKLRGVIHTPAPNTVAKYMKAMPDKPKPPSEKQKQSWKTFIKNHLSVTWAVDFFTIPTFNFNILHVLVIVHHKTRRIVHFNVTTNPDAEWVVQQFRYATPYGEVPKYLIHDNDPLFRSNKFQRFLKISGIQSKRTAYKSPWQNAYTERAIGTLKRECTDHIIPFNERHIHDLLHDYILNYYNSNRTHQGLDGQTPIPTPTHLPVNVEDIKLKATPVMNGLYHTYKRIA